ncbi:hypothetical protein QJQ45_016513 [Haematococcus lacustris]|nr:hypothetical protein QJQ45_016513 [Haematococcus lacustris]
MVASVAVMVPQVVLGFEPIPAPTRSSSLEPAAGSRSLLSELLTAMGQTDHDTWQNEQEADSDEPFDDVICDSCDSSQHSEFRSPAVDIPLHTRQAIYAFMASMCFMLLHPLVGVAQQDRNASIAEAIRIVTQL